MTPQPGVGEIVPINRPEATILPRATDVLAQAPADLRERVPGLFDQGVTEAIDVMWAEQRAKLVPSRDILGYQGENRDLQIQRDNFRRQREGNPALFDEVMRFRDTIVLPLAQEGCRDGVTNGLAVLSEVVGDRPTAEKAQRALELGTRHRMPLEAERINTVAAIEQGLSDIQPPPQQELVGLESYVRQADLIGLTGLQGDFNNRLIINELYRTYQDPTEGGRYPTTTQDAVVAAIRRGLARRVASDMVGMTIDHMRNTDPHYRDTIDEAIQAERKILEPSESPEATTEGIAALEKKEAAEALRDIAETAATE